VTDTAATLELLRAHGVKRARFDGAALAEVEFFGPESPTHGVSAADGETGRGPARSDGTEPYLHALEQIRVKRFVQRNGTEGES
jgi:hypothetical protein